MPYSVIATSTIFANNAIVVLDLVIVLFLVERIIPF